MHVYHELIHMLCIVLAYLMAIKFAPNGWTLFMKMNIGWLYVHVACADKKGVFSLVDRSCNVDELLKQCFINFSYAL